MVLDRPVTKVVFRAGPFGIKIFLQGLTFFVAVHSPILMPK
jgi:hypothetical protein